MIRFKSWKETKEEEKYKTGLDLWWKKSTVDNVPKPQRLYALNPQYMQEFLENSSNEEEHALRTMFLRQLRHISWQEFLKALCISVTSLVRSLGTSEWVACSFTKPEDEAWWYGRNEVRKSGAWVMDLSHAYCAAQTKLSDPIAIIDSQADAEMILPFLGDELRHFVFFDDMLYSGSQMDSSVTSFIRFLYLQTITSNIGDLQRMGNCIIHIVVPFSTPANKMYPGKQTKNAKQTATAEFRAFYGHNPVKHSQVRLYQTIDKRTNRIVLVPYQVQFHIAEIIPWLDHEYADRRIAVYFDHKLADSHSVPTQAIAPLIDGCEAFYRIPDGKGFRELTMAEKHSPPCPPVPYKQSSL